MKKSSIISMIFDYYRSSIFTDALHKEIQNYIDGYRNLILQSSENCIIFMIYTMYDFNSIPITINNRTKEYSIITKEECLSLFLQFCKKNLYKSLNFDKYDGADDDINHLTYHCNYNLFKIMTNKCKLDVRELECLYDLIFDNNIINELNSYHRAAVFESGKRMHLLFEKQITNAANSKLYYIDNIMFWNVNNAINYNKLNAVNVCTMPPKNYSNINIEIISLLIAILSKCTNNMFTIKDNISLSITNNTYLPQIVSVKSITFLCDLIPIITAVNYIELISETDGFASVYRCIHPKELINYHLHNNKNVINISSYIPNSIICEPLANLSFNNFSTNFSVRSYDLEEKILSNINDSFIDNNYQSSISSSYTTPIKISKAFRESAIENPNIPSNDTIQSFECDKTSLIRNITSDAHLKICQRYLDNLMKERHYLYKDDYYTIINQCANILSLKCISASKYNKNIIEKLINYMLLQVIQCSQFKKRIFDIEEKIYNKFKNHKFSSYDSNYTFSLSMPKTALTTFSMFTNVDSINDNLVKIRLPYTISIYYADVLIFQNNFYSCYTVDIDNDTESANHIKGTESYIMPTDKNITNNKSVFEKYFNNYSYNSITEIQRIFSENINENIDIFIEFGCDFLTLYNEMIMYLNVINMCCYSSNLNINVTPQELSWLWDIAAIHDNICKQIKYNGDIVSFITELNYYTCSDNTITTAQEAIGITDNI